MFVAFSVRTLAKNNSGSSFFLDPELQNNFSTLLRWDMFRISLWSCVECRILYKKNIYKEDQCCLKTHSEASWFWTTMTTIQTVKPQPKRNWRDLSVHIIFKKCMCPVYLEKKLCRVCIYEYTYIKIYLYIRCHWCHLYHGLKKKPRGSRTKTPSSRADFLRACAGDVRAGHGRTIENQWHATCSIFLWETLWETKVPHQMRVFKFCVLLVRTCQIECQLVVMIARNNSFLLLHKGS